MTENNRWSFTGGVIVGTDICEKGIPHTNRSVVTHLNRYERKIRELEDENEQLKKQLDDNLQFLIRASQKHGFESLDHLLYTLEEGEIFGYSTANWTGGKQ